MNQVVLFGDSLTAGRIGISYRRYIPLPSEARGVEGELWSGTIKRVLTYLEKSIRVGRTITLVLQTGANDLLLPEMARRYHQWKTSQFPIDAAREDHKVFQQMGTEDLKAICAQVPLVVCSLPVLGEQLDSELNKRRRERNELLYHMVTQISHASFCDIATSVEQVIREHGGNSDYFPPSPQSIAEDVAFVGTDELRAAQCSKNRGLIATIDGVHPNAVEAQLISAAITATLPW
jgi:lysophospholipase L1-like esterase